MARLDIFSIKVISKHTHIAKNVLAKQRGVFKWEKNRDFVESVTRRRNVNAGNQFLAIAVFVPSANRHCYCTKSSVLHKVVGITCSRDIQCVVCASQRVCKKLIVVINIVVFS
jgi:hypothetical protein